MPGRTRPRSWNPHASAGAKCDHTDCLLQAELAAIPYPVPEQVGVNRRIGYLAQVGSRVGEGHDGAGMTKCPQENRLVLLEQTRLDEQLAAFGLDAQIDHRLGRMYPTFACDVCHGRVGREPLAVDAKCPRSRVAGPALRVPSNLRNRR